MMMTGPGGTDEEDSSDPFEEACSGCGNDAVIRDTKYGLLCADCEAKRDATDEESIIAKARGNVQGSYDNVDLALVRMVATANGQLAAANQMYVDQYNKAERYREELLRVQRELEHLQLRVREMTEAGVVLTLHVNDAVEQLIRDDRKEDARRLLNYNGRFASTLPGDLS